MLSPGSWPIHHPATDRIRTAPLLHYTFFFFICFCGNLFVGWGLAGLAPQALPQNRLPHASCRSVGILAAGYPLLSVVGRSGLARASSHRNHSSETAAHLCLRRVGAFCCWESGEG